MAPLVSTGQSCWWLIYNLSGRVTWGQSREQQAQDYKDHKSDTQTHILALSGAQEERKRFILLFVESGRGGESEKQGNYWTKPVGVEGMERDVVDKG